MLKKASFSPTQPRRATRVLPDKAAGDDKTGGVPLGYVEDLRVENAEGGLFQHPIIRSHATETIAPLSPARPQPEFEGGRAR
jgi:hypothetical protein